MTLDTTPSPEADAASILTDTALVPVAPRDDGWTPRRQREFIESLADTGCVTTAARTVGMSASSAYRLRRRTDARAFDAAWQAALERAMERLLPAALDRALNGTLRQRWYHGEMVAEERVYHDDLLRYLLERGDGMLGAAQAREALRDDWDAHMTALENGAVDPPVPLEPEPWECDVDDEDRWITNAPAPPGSPPAEPLPLPGYDGWRHATEEEIAAIERFEALGVAEKEASRRRYFQLD